MKVAALILGHKNPIQLKRLISALQHPLIDIYIHLDQKSSLSPSDFLEYDVRFTEKRVDVALFDFSMVEAELELLRTACRYDRYGYFILLSGQCYPLRHIQDIHQYLCSTYPKPLIEVISPEIVTKFARQFQYPHVLKRFRTASEAFLRKHLPGKSIYPYKYIPEGIVFAATLVKSMLVPSPRERLKRMGMKPYFGPQWWILPDTAVEEILRLAEDSAFCACMCDCFCCDETFFQTAIMVHGDRYPITLNEKGYYLNKKWYTVFSHGHPIVFRQEHFDRLISSGMLFARKFDMDVDAEILDLLDRHSESLLGQKIAAPHG